MILGTALSGQVSDRTPTANQAQRISDRIRALQAEADGLAAQQRTLLDDLRALEVERQIQLEHVTKAESDVAKHQDAIKESDRRLAALEQQRETQLPDVKAQLVEIYKRGRTGYARLLFGSTSVREFGRSLRAVSALIRINQNRVAEHLRTLEAVRQQRSTLESELRAVRTQEEEARQARVAADRALAARTALVSNIDSRRDMTAQLAGELEVAYARLQQQMANIAAGQPSEAVSVPLAPFRGTLDWPVTGRINTRFGQLSGRIGDTAVRNGIEIAAVEDSPVQAVHWGAVSYAEPFAGFGNLVIVDHGGNNLSLYGYLSSISVTRGQVVDVGTEVGRVGSPPAGLPALYFEMRIDGRSVDPVQWLKAP
jgi:septal ring factor EnvC (AmiA/AmiB activator)